MSAMTSSAEEGDAIQVFVRVRPEADTDGIPCLSADAANKSIVVQCRPDAKVFTFDAVADATATQEAVFVSVARRLIESCVAGYNATVFAYGQTGSGKTFTMLGPSEDADNFQHEMRGVIPRTFEQLFGLIARELQMSGKCLEFLCKCSFLEIYNEQVYDLLDNASSGLHLRENIQRGVFVEGLSEEAVVNANEAYQVLINGWQNRRVASTSMNRESSRSHAVFTIQVESKETKNGLQNIRQGMLNLVDLAGSERQKDTRAAGQRLKEASSINRSLSALGNVIMALVDVMNGRSRHVPYRDSKLTFLLRDSLGGNAKTCMVACIHPGSRCLNETLSTLQFARRAKMIRNKAVVNEDTHGNVVVLQAEIRKLREQLAQWQLGRELSPSAPAAATAARDDFSLDNGHDRQEYIGAGTGDKHATTVEDCKLSFLNAMLLVDKSEKEKLELERRAQAAEDLCLKHEKFLQSTKMIVKFRENCIRRLELGKPSNDHSDSVADLQEEIGLLRAQLDLNPAAARYATENKNLKYELQKLLASTATADARELALKQREQLELLYRQLAPRLAASHSSEDGAVYVAQTSDYAAHSAALERCKDQVQTLQATLDTVRAEAASEREAAVCKESSLECELAALRRSYDELEKLLAARQLQTRLDRDAAGEAHVQTLLGIATPKKSPCSAVAARRAAAAATASPLLMPLGDFNECGDTRQQSCPSTPSAAAVTTTADEQELNAAAAAAAVEALAEQVRKLQAGNDELHEKVDAMESECVKSRQHATRLEHVNQALQDQYNSKVQELDETNKRLAALAAQLATKLTDHDLLQSEVSDLRILLKAADSELAQSKAARRESELNASRSVEVVEAKLVKMTCELSSLQTQHSSLLLERTALQEELESAHITCSFHEDRLQSTEALLQHEQARASQAEAELQSALGKLDAERLRNAALLSQAQDAEAKELADAVERCQRLGDECGRLTAALADSAANVEASTKENDFFRTECASLQKEIGLHKDSASKLALRVQDQKASMALLEKSASELTHDLADKVEQLASAHAAAADLARSNEELKKQLDALARSAEVKSRKYEVEMAMMKDEYDTVSAECQKLEAELALTNDSLVKVKTAVDQKNTVISTMQEEVEKKARALVNLKAEHDAMLSKVPHPFLAAAGSSREMRQFQSPAGEREDLRVLIAALERDNESYRSRQVALGSLLEELERGRQEKNGELSVLKSQLEQQKRAEEDRASRMIALESELLLLRQENETRRGEARLHSKESAAARAALQAAERSKDEALNEKYEAYNELTAMQSQYEKLLAEKLDLQATAERLKDIANKDHEQMTRVQSELEVAFEQLKRYSSDTSSLRKQLDRLEKQNAQLVGHNNTKQKIQYHMQLKDENRHLKEQVQKLSAALRAAPVPFVLDASMPGRSADLSYDS